MWYIMTIMRNVKLILVDGVNESAKKLGNNKYYNMTDNGDGTFTVAYGRVGRNEATQTYPVSRWSSIYNSKLRKGYKDVTEFAATEKAEVVVDHEDPLVKGLLEHLYRASQSRATRMYNVSFSAVTSTMIDTAQEIIDEIATTEQTIDGFRSLFLRLFTIIPRKMENVEHHLPMALADIQRLVKEEQDTLESLKGQVVPVAENKQQLLDTLGITIKPVVQLPDQFQTVRYNRAFEVEHSSSNQKFGQWAHLDRKLLYHGSRATNWLSILRTGLQIRPAANGTLFGNGIYFADDIRKSRSYSDGYVGVYDVAVGKQHPAMYTNSRLSLNTIDGDSVYAQRGGSGYAEYVVFRQEQCTIKYLLDMR